MASRILVCLDGSPRAERVLPYALACARAGGADSEIILAQVPLPLSLVPRLTPGTYRELVEGLALKVAGSLEGLASELRQRGPRVSWRTPRGSALEAIISLAEAERADLLVLGSHARTGVKRWVLGSTAEKIIRHSQIPVLLIAAGVTPTNWREMEPPEFRTVVVPLDGSEFSEAALRFPEILSCQPEAIHLVQATDIPAFIPRDLLDAEVVAEMMQRSHDYLAEVVTRRKLIAHEVTCRSCDMPAHEGILLLAEFLEPDLIAMATQGRDGLSRALMGSVAETVARAADCPILLIPPHE